MNFLKLFLCSIVNGVTATGELNTRRANDGRHPPFIVSFALPAAHDAWPEGTLMVAGDSLGEAVAAEPDDTDDIIGVLDIRVDANEQSGNVMIHGSCPAELLVCFDEGVSTPASAAQIAALRKGAIAYV